MVLETTSRPPGRVETGPTVAEVMADAFVAAGADTQFGLMGDPNMHFMAAARSRARLFDIRHEGAADAMADGYSRVSGRVGVATVTSGAGLMYRRPTGDLFVRGDARLSAERLVARLDDAGHRNGGYRDDDEFITFMQTDQRERDFEDGDWDIEPGTVHCRRFMLELDPLLPRNCHVVIGAQ